MIDDSEIGNMVKTGSICKVTELQALLFQPCRTAGTYLSSFLQNTLKTNQVEINTDNKTLKPVAKLKEPRDLFALPKELDCSQQAARWPSECQVLEERVQHIEYVPPAPELYYQPTGREIQPKPVGEEAGTIVFQYYPMSAVNYFSRSSVGGSRYFLPACPISKENDDDLKFESRFESGNLAKVVKITETYYELYLRTDMYTNRHMQWFYFRIQNTKKHIIYRFSFVNLSKGDSLYSVGMKPLLYSTKDAQLSAVGWRRCGDNITYYKNDPISEEEDETPNYTLSFNIEFPHDQDEVYLAHCYPYTYTDLQDYLNKLQNHPIKSNFTKLRLLCRTLAGNNVYYVTITEPPVGDEPKKKKAVVVTARVHPGETPSSWMMKGLIDFLTGDTDQAKELREKFIFKLVPMLNPDGVIVGNNRCSLTGRDLNRQYRTVIRETYPPVWHTKLMIRRLMEECGIVMYCDLHAHSRKHNVFIYGCENKRYLDRRLEEQVFPLMLHKNAADKFSFENCKFRIQRSKEGTGRVVVWMMGVANSYTMEASFAGSTLGSRVDTHFNIQDFESMGKAFCETLLDFCDEEPSKEKLRMKIIERLLKEGSSADEPTNINLSDYSSDEGDSSSCSGDGPILNKNSSVWNEEGPRSVPETVPHRPPSSTLPKKETTTKFTTRVSSAKIPKKIGIVEKTPPLPRKPLQVHKTTLDPPCLEQNNDVVDVNTTEIDSGDESASWQKGVRKLKVNERGKKMKKRRMPPELIVTPAQVLETPHICDKVIFKEPKKKVAQTKRKNFNGDSRGEKIWLWHHTKCIQTNNKTGKSISDLTTEVRLKMGTSLKQRIWMGCPCEANQIPLSKGSSLAFTHWTKGPLSWASNFLPQSSNETKTCTPKLPIQEKVQKLMIGQTEDITIAASRKKSHTKKALHTQEHGNHSEHQRKSSQRSRIRSQKNVKQLSFHMGNDPVSQVALLKLSDSSSTKSHNRKSGSKAEDDVASKTSKFRKSGLVVAAVSRRRYGTADSDSEKNVAEKIIHSKKKKRKTSTLKKTKCIQSPAKSESIKIIDN